MADQNLRWCWKEGSSCCRLEFIAVVVDFNSNPEKERVIEGWQTTPAKWLTSLTVILVFPLWCMAYKSLYTAVNATFISVLSWWEDQVKVFSLSCWNCAQSPKRCRRTWRTKEHVILSLPQTFRSTTSGDTWLSLDREGIPVIRKVKTAQSCQTNLTG